MHFVLSAWISVELQAHVTVSFLLSIILGNLQKPLTSGELCLLPWLFGTFKMNWLTKWLNK